MDDEQIYELVYEAVIAALADERGGRDIRLSRRLIDGKVTFTDGQERVVKEIDVHTLFRKITSIREKLRVLEQKINNNGGLSSKDKAELQGYVTRCYGSLTTFNFLFQDEPDKFQGTGT